MECVQMLTYDLVPKRKKQNKIKTANKQIENRANGRITIKL